MLQINKAHTDNSLSRIIEWADAHKAHASLPYLLRHAYRLCGGRFDIFVEWSFRGQEHESQIPFFETTSSSPLKLGVGDAAVAASYINHERNYKKVIFTKFIWQKDSLAWLDGGGPTEFYAKAFPLGSYTKWMPVEWGVRMES